MRLINTKNFITFPSYFSVNWSSKCQSLLRCWMFLIELKVSVNNSSAPLSMYLTERKKIKGTRIKVYKKTCLSLNNRLYLRIHKTLVATQNLLQTQDTCVKSCKRFGGRLTAQTCICLLSWNKPYPAVPAWCLWNSSIVYSQACWKLYVIYTS